MAETATPIRPEPMYPVDVERAPTILLGGKPWPIPELAIAQSKHVTPALTSIMPMIGKMMAAVSTGPDGKIIVDEKRMAGLMGMIDEATYTAITDAIFWSLKRATPGLGRGEFEQFPIKFNELMAAIPVIIKQVGFVEAKQSAGGAAGAGEAPAAPGSIGTD